MNPHLFYCKNPYYVLDDQEAERPEYKNGSNEARGAECKELYTDQCAELYRALNDDIWIRLVDDQINFHSAVEVGFYTDEYTIMELLIIAVQMFNEKKKYNWEKHEHLIYDHTTYALLTRLLELQPMLYAVECLAFIRNELDFISDKVWNYIEEGGKC